MKIYVVLLAVMLAAPSAFSQYHEFLGRDRDILTEAANVSGDSLLLSDKTSDGMYEFDMFGVSETLRVIFYYKKDKCVIVSAVYPVQHLRFAIESLNKQYIRYDKTDWMGKSLKVKIQLHLTEKEFAVKYSYVGDSQKE